MPLNIPPVHASIAHTNNPQQTQVQQQPPQSQPMAVPQTGLEHNMLRLADYRDAEVQDVPRTENDEIQEEDGKQRNPRYYQPRSGKRRRSIKHRQAIDLDESYLINVRR